MIFYKMLQGPRSGDSMTAGDARTKLSVTDILHPVTPCVNKLVICNHGLVSPDDIKPWYQTTILCTKSFWILWPLAPGRAMHCNEWLKRRMQKLHCLLFVCDWVWAASLNYICFGSLPINADCRSPTTCISHLATHLVMYIPMCLVLPQTFYCFTVFILHVRLDLLTHKASSLIL